MRLRALEDSPDVLDGYSHEYVVITHRTWWERDRAITLLCSAVERLGSRGWEPVAWNMGDRRSSIVLRRRDPAPETEQPG